MPDLDRPSDLVLSGREAPGWSWLRAAIAAAAALLVLRAVASYPLLPALLGAVLLLYGAALWRWPALWLVAVPAALPAFDLAPWTGWTDVAESDLVVLVTLAVLVWRAPPRRRDFLPERWSAAAIALLLAATAIGLARGLAVPGLPGGSAIPDLRPEDALRIAKGFAAALALLPFLRRAFDERRDAPHRFALGMVAGLATVVAAAVLERGLFPGVLDFATPYRIVATFSSMQFGGDAVGVYLAMAFPFALALLRRRSGWAGPAAFVAAGALYALIVTFARAAMGSALVGALVFVLARACAAGMGRARPASLALPVALLLVAAGAVLAVVEASPYMEFRMRTLAPDLAWREAMWADGLALRSPGLGTALAGMGLGTYARTLAATLPPRERSGNAVLESDHGIADLALTGGLPLYVGERVAAGPYETDRLSFAMRSHAPGTIVGAALCEKMMLYSMHCSFVAARPLPGAGWQHFEAALQTGRIDSYVRLGFLRRPVELAFFLPVPGTSADLRDVSLVGADGRERVVNGDFAQGLAHWVFTDDAHTVWRIENQYLMTLFEEGALGLAALLLLAAAALRGGALALARGEPLAPAFLAALAAVLASGLFECALDGPRLAALFYLIAFAAMTMGEATGAFAAQGRGDSIGPSLPDGRTP